MANEYLQRTPTSTGNRRVFTWSGWLKLNSLSTSYTSIMEAFTGASDVYCTIAVSSNTIQINQDNGAGGVMTVTATPLHRDPSSWFHLLVSVDTTQTLAQNRVRIYVNGDEEVITYSNAPSINLETHFNRTGGHRIGTRWNLSGYINAEYTDVFLIDGQALTPDVFGFYKQGKGYISVGSTQSTDFRPGQWVPKTPRVIKTEINRRGGFGVNGFYLPMNDSRNFGADFHGDPNSIITLNEKLPQPRVGVASTAVGIGYTDALRADPYAANLVLAIPGVIGGQGSGYGDYSANIKGSGSNKTVTAVGNAGVAVTASYYGSALSFDGSGDYLTIPASSDFNFGTGDFTAEFWVYSNPANSSTYRRWLTTSNGNFSSSTWVIREDGSVDKSIGINAGRISASSAFQRGQWNHIAYVKFNNIESVYVNGVCVGISTSSYSYTEGGTNGLYIGGFNFSSSEYFDGYLQDLRIYKGVAKYTGGFDVPRPYTPVGIATWRAVPDTNANNFATLNPIGLGGGTLTNGNLTSLTSSTTPSVGNIGITTGKWYWEVRASTTTNPRVGVYNIGATNPADLGATVNGWAILNNPSRTYNNGSTTAYGSFNGSFGDIVMVAYDASNGRIWYGSNGTFFSSGNPASNLNPSQTGVGATGSALVPAVASGTGINCFDCNFGQNPTFSGSIGNFAFKTAKIYSVYNGAARSANYTVQYSDDNTNWTTAWTGISTNNSSCGIQQNSGGGGSYGVHRYWRYVEGSAVVGHHPRVSKIILSDGINDVNIVTYASDNCSDTGEYVIGTITYDGKDGAGTFTDSNSKGLFKYQPPSGFLALCEDNLPTPAISDPGKYFKTVLWTGDGNSGRSIVGVGFTPDLVWTKYRNVVNNHHIFDSLRGPFLSLKSNTTGADQLLNTTFLSINSDGFSLGSSGDVNASGGTYVAWCWRAGAGTTSTNTNGSITSVVSVNQDAGFSIVSYTGNGSSTATVGHGLGRTPAFLISKARGTTNDWWLVHKSGNGNLQLNTTSALVTSGGTNGAMGFPSTLTSSTFTFTNGSSSVNNVNQNGIAYIAYCWAEIEGFSKFGSYNGNGSTDGPFVYCGFKPAWVMIKRTDSTQNWPIIDSSRDSVNVANRRLFANLSDIEDQGISNFVDILSNGFKCRDSNVSYNASGGTYIFAAFAESPFSYSNSK